MDAGLEHLQEDADGCPKKSFLGTKCSRAVRETEALLSDLMVDQPLFWLLTASLVGFLLGKRLLGKN
ncbi:hypothetical protein [Gluconobacter kondonii]|uniref:hypothetical protein n=1 Tax=Gluconobacter kondonii TaxID=941463 RepID=UPI001B8B5185|nr:hypothetical protein [Gluconobacter kondonii]MBS1053082.1 hypothetical protein [Gluconobacter kondonii]MBS1056708.1 hypothetical protein [Gluconobacter kondonii]MBS1065364.1 hypothetical protein [Gluconobacter kondonii]MBS1079945.1 hypothetical protein [Gluconobacter kondonii]MBS1082818.1 hypothetical protein [Gluconobacter kondonii]